MSQSEPTPNQSLNSGDKFLTLFLMDAGGQAMNFRSTLAMGAIMAANCAISLDAEAMPPPPPVEAIVLSSDKETEGLAEGYLSLVAHSGAFKRVPASIDASLFRSCHGETLVTCVRARLAEQAIKGAVVVVLARQASDGAQAWTCLGSDGARYAPERQNVTLDLKQGLFGTREVKFRESMLASSCVLAAAAESGW